MCKQHESPDQAFDADTSESEVEEVRDLQTPKPKGKPDTQRQKEHEKAEREFRKQEEARERQHKKEGRRRRKRPKRTSAQIEEERRRGYIGNRSRCGIPITQKQGQSTASTLPCNVVSKLAYSRPTAIAMASDWRAHVPLDDDCRWTIPDMQTCTR